MDDQDIWIGIGGLVIFLAVISGSLFGTYRLGRTLERKALTSALIKSISETYDEGVQDGLKEGYNKGWKEALKTCDDALYLESGRR